MGPRGSGKLLAIAGVLCFILAFVLLGTFKGEFGKDTAGKPSVMPVMEDTIDVTPAAGKGRFRRGRGLRQMDSLCHGRGEEAGRI